jgi:hypothetical protein
MFILIFFVLDVLPGIPVATKAYLGFFCLPQGSLVRGMGAVAVHAKHALVDVAAYLLEFFLSTWVATRTQGCPPVFKA